MSNPERTHGVSKDLEAMTVRILSVVDNSLRRNNPGVALAVVSALAAAFVEHHFDRPTAEAFDERIRRALDQLAVTMRRRPRPQPSRN
jgi:hypothetical protein